jgi:type 1 fimbriae regulatory protein FimB/type 1 fimbriae regulatory protein FimE
MIERAAKAASLGIKAHAHMLRFWPTGTAGGRPKSSICARGLFRGRPPLTPPWRHGCGYKLANDGIDTRALQAYLGHRNIQNTTRYTALAPDRFKGFWKD